MIVLVIINIAFLEYGRDAPADHQYSPPQNMGPTCQIIFFCLLFSFLLPPVASSSPPPLRASTSTEIPLPTTAMAAGTAPHAPPGNPGPIPAHPCRIEAEFRGWARLPLRQPELTSSLAPQAMEPRAAAVASYGAPSPLSSLAMEPICPRPWRSSTLSCPSAMEPLLFSALRSEPSSMPWTPPASSCAASVTCAAYSDIAG